MQAFQILAQEAAECTLCPAMESRTAVLSERNGTLSPRVLFIAEAPGRKGGDRTRIPMCGDATGRTFEGLLASIGLTREQVFITNAVLCNPRKDTGANRPPTAGEVRSCNSFLQRLIDLLDPPVVATLGAKALSALALIKAHDLALSTHAGTEVEWNGRTVVPLYHPSPQVLISRRNFDEQKRDWQAIRSLLR